MKNLCETIPGKNIFKVEKTLVQYNLEWNLLRCVTTNDANICGGEKDKFTKCVLNVTVIHGIYYSISRYPAENI